jgi:hypothetical protein
VCLGLLAEEAVRANLTPFAGAHVALVLRCMDGRKARQKSVYRPQDAGNACYALKAAIDGIVDAGLLADDSYEHVRFLTTSVQRVESMDLEGLFVRIEEIERPEVGEEA